MSHVDQWWMQTKVQSEYTVICIFLELEDSPDPVVLNLLLDFPAAACGYPPRHVKVGGL